MIDELLKQPDFSVENINLGEYLDSISFAERDKTLGLVMNKLSLTGEITIVGNDFGVLCNLIASNAIDTPNGNAIMEPIKSMVSANDMVRIISSNNLKIVKKDFHGFKYMFVAKRA